MTGRAGSSTRGAKEEASVSADGGDSVRSLLRGLEVLRYINEFRDTRPSTIGRHLGIPRPTVCRLLNTLEANGYIIRCGSSGKPLISERTAALAKTYKSRTRLVQVGERALMDAHNDILWPVDLSRRLGTEMIIFETTHGVSPYSLDTNMLGKRLPLLSSSSGQCYLAHCDEAEREEILQNMLLGLEDDRRKALEAQFSYVTSSDIREKGYALRAAGQFMPRTSSFSIPFRRGEKLLGCITMIWPRRAMSGAEAVGKHLPRLQAVATRLNREI